MAQGAVANPGVLKQQAQTLLPPDYIAGQQALKGVLAQYPGFSNVYNEGNTAVVFADPKRSTLNKKYGGGGSLEYWPPDETGDTNFPRPAGYDNKHVLEIYDPALRQNPTALNDAVYGDLLHGMVNDPQFSQMRQQFIANYPPDIANFNEKWRKTHQNVSPNALDDMYIRGRLAKNQGDEWNDPSRYSPVQLQLLEQMRNYISGKKPVKK